MKKQVRRHQDSFSLWEYDGDTVAEIIRKLQTLPQDWKVEIDIRGDYENNSYFYCLGEETDEEYEARLVREERTKENERQQYERLKTKFENGEK